MTKSPFIAFSQLADDSKCRDTTSFRSEVEGEVHVEVRPLEVHLEVLELVHRRQVVPGLQVPHRHVVECVLWKCDGVNERQVEVVVVPVESVQFPDSEHVQDPAFVEVDPHQEVPVVVFHTSFCFRVQKHEERVTKLEVPIVEQVWVQCPTRQVKLQASQTQCLLGSDDCPKSRSVVAPIVPWVGASLVEVPVGLLLKLQGQKLCTKLFFNDSELRSWPPTPYPVSIYLNSLLLL